MPGKVDLQHDTLPENLNSIEKFWEFWDTHSSADYEDFMEPVEAEVDLLSSKMYCAIAKDVKCESRLASKAYQPRP